MTEDRCTPQLILYTFQWKKIMLAVLTVPPKHEFIYIDLTIPFYHQFELLQSQTSNQSTYALTRLN